MPMTLESTVTQSQDQVTADIDGQLVMMSIEKGEYFGLDEVGTRIWDLIEQPRSVDQLCSRLQEEFEIDNETCEKHVLGFLDNLSQLGLVDVT